MDNAVFMGVLERQQDLQNQRRGDLGGNAGFPVLRRRRAAHQQNVLRSPADSQAVGDCCFLPGGALTGPEPRKVHADAGLEALSD